MEKIIVVVNDVEMDEILRDKELVKNLRLGQEEVLNGEYTILSRVHFNAPKSVIY